MPAASIQIDRQAMALLDQLLDASAAERSDALGAIQDTQPGVHLRLQQLLRASDAATYDGAAQAWAAPLTAGLQAAVLPGPQAGTLIASYRLLRPLGQGGMSSVWLAERADGQLKRQVAIKLPLSAHLSALLAERFSRERDVLAALDHPHIARLIDAGVAASGQPYLVLEYVAGVPITEHATALALPAKLRLFLQVLSAVEHAHRHMTVHRDLKPSNILVDAQGQAKLLDFGIAKLLAAPPGTTALTQDAASVLTPRYAAPEQVTGEAVTTATDVYSAGVVLYELLTGRLPYGAAGDSAATLLHAVAHAQALPPRLTVNLDTVLLKALRKAPAERYASIERLAEDIRRLLAHQPILARRVPWSQRFLLLLRRRRWASAAAASGALVLALTGVVAWQQAHESSAQKDRADKVREFVYTMVSDAEPDQGKSEVTGLEMIDAAVARAQTDFAADPRLHGELLAELGRIYFRLQRPEKSVATLERSLSLLTPLAAPDDPALNRTRAELAQSLVQRDNQRAGTLAEQALSGCSRANAECAYVRARARYALSVLCGWTGRFPQALEHARAMVRESQAAFGSQAMQVFPALETWASAARNNGDLHEAAEAVLQAQAMASNQTLKSINRVRLDVLQAVLEVDLGQYVQARQNLQRLTQGHATASEQSIQWRWLAAAELGLGRPEAALQAADQAQRLAPPGAIGWLARQAWGDIASHLNRHDEALVALTQAQAGLVQLGMPSQSAAVMRVRRQTAEALVRQGLDAAAMESLRTLVAEHAAVDAPRAVESALAMDALACVAALSGDLAEARRLHTASLARYFTTLPAAHTHRLRSALLLALIDGDPAPALQRWRDALAADSPWRPRAVVDCRAVI